MENLAILLKDRGQPDEAVEWYRKAVNQAMASINAQPRSYRPWPGESEDGGVSNAILGFAELLAETDVLDEAEYWFREIAERGDARAAAALANAHAHRGELAEAAAWRRTAAELADALLMRSKRSLQRAYGNAGILRHVRIIQDYADDLATRGEQTAADQWRLRAANHMASSP